MPPLIVSLPAAASEGPEQDLAPCTEARGTAAEIVVACTRPIDNGAAENEITGMFYGMRASMNDDRVQNCSDAQKSLQLATDAGIKEISQKLIEQNC